MCKLISRVAAASICLAALVASAHAEWIGLIEVRDQVYPYLQVGDAYAAVPSVLVTLGPNATILGSVHCQAGPNGPGEASSETSFQFRVVWEATDPENDGPAPVGCYGDYTGSLNGGMYGRTTLEPNMVINIDDYLFYGDVGTGVGISPDNWYDLHGEDGKLVTKWINGQLSTGVRITDGFLYEPHSHASASAIFTGVFRPAFTRGGEGGW